MIEFDLERAKNGDKVTTRDGRVVRLFCFDWTAKCDHKILGGVREPSGAESLVTWLLSGGYYPSLKVSANDLVMAPKRVGEMKYKTFGELSKEEQNELLYEYYVEKSEVEWYDGELCSWVRTSMPFWVKSCQYRVAKTKPSIDWNAVHPDYNYLTMDSLRVGVLHKREPNIRAMYRSAPLCVGPTITTAGFASFKPGNCDWKDSLIKRPGV